MFSFEVAQLTALAKKGAPSQNVGRPSTAAKMLCSKGSPPIIPKLSATARAPYTRPRISSVTMDVTRESMPTRKGNPTAKAASAVPRGIRETLGRLEDALTRYQKIDVRRDPKK
jgi:hypothetical protein